MPLSSFAQNTTTTIDVTNVQITPKTYVTIDVSTNVTNGNYVSLMAFDDQNNFAFGFEDTSSHRYNVWNASPGMSYTSYSLPASTNIACLSG
jgi:DICT domain-containing protein